MISEALKEEIQDWIYYRDAHPDLPYTYQWGMELLASIAKENGLDD